MSAALDSMRNWFYGRKPTEQMLVVLGGLALMYAIADGLLVTPMTAYHKGLKASADAQYGTAEKMRSELAELHRDDPDVVRQQLLEKHSATQARLLEEEQLTQAVEKSLVGAQQIMKVLGGMLSAHKAVTIARIENLPAASQQKAAPNTTEADKDGSTSAAEQQVFRHSIRVTLRGKYVDIVRYLQAVETLPWRIFWDAMALESNDYPWSSVTVEFHTLSTDEAWFKLS